MPIHEIAVVFYVDAPDYDAAISATKHWTNHQRDVHLTKDKSPFYEELPEGTIDIEDLPIFEYDELGQRVLYLEPENGYRRNAEGSIIALEDPDHTDTYKYVPPADADNVCEACECCECEEEV